MSNFSPSLLLKEHIATIIGKMKGSPLNMNPIFQTKSQSNGNIRSNLKLTGVFPEIVHQEIRGFPRQPSKNHLRTYKSLKNLDSDNDLKLLKFPSLENVDDKRLDNSGSLQSVKVKIHTPIKKRHLRALLNPPDLPSPPVELSPSLDFEGNLTNPSVPPRLSMPQYLRKETFNERSQVRSKSGLHESSSPLSLSSIKEIPEDPFYYANMIKNSSFSAFTQILDGQQEVISSPYPYFSTIAKGTGKNKAKSKRVKQRKLKLENECKCPEKNTDRNYWEVDYEEIRNNLPKLKEVKSQVPSLSRVQFYPQKVKCIRNVLIIYFEGTFAVSSDTFYIRKGIWKLLSKLSGLFQTVFVVPSSFDKEFLFNLFDEKKVCVAGLYTIHCAPYCSREAEKLQDYSQIYFDFDCQYPQKDCIIISNHQLFDSSNNSEDLIFIKKGVIPKLVAQGIPVSSFEFPDPPCVVLLPHLNIEDKCIDVLIKLAADLENYLQEFRCFRDFLDFYLYFRKSEYKIVKTIECHHLLLKCIDDHLLRKYSSRSNNFGHKAIVYCTLHHRYYKSYPHNYPSNNFVIN